MTRIGKSVEKEDRMYLPRTRWGRKEQRDGVTANVGTRFLFRVIKMS